VRTFLVQALNSFSFRYLIRIAKIIYIFDINKQNNHRAFDSHLLSVLGDNGIDKSVPTATSPFIHHYLLINSKLRSYQSDILCLENDNQSNTRFTNISFISFHCKSISSSFGADGADKFPSFYIWWTFQRSTPRLYRVEQVTILVSTPPM
jgi:hypothetical protein